MTVAHTKLTAFEDGMLRLEVPDYVPTRQAASALPHSPATPPAQHPLSEDGCRVGRPFPMATASHQFEFEVGSCNTLRLRAVRRRVSTGSGACRSAARDVAMGLLIALAVIGALLV